MLKVNLMFKEIFINLIEFDLINRKESLVISNIITSIYLGDGQRNKMTFILTSQALGFSRKGFISVTIVFIGY